MLPLILNEARFIRAFFMSAKKCESVAGCQAVGMDNSSQLSTMNPAIGGIAVLGAYNENNKKLVTFKLNGISSSLW